MQRHKRELEMDALPPNVQEVLCAPGLECLCVAEKIVNRAFYDGGRESILSNEDLAGRMIKLPSPNRKE